LKTLLSVGKVATETTTETKTSEDCQLSKSRHYQLDGGVHEAYPSGASRVTTDLLAGEVTDDDGERVQVLLRDVD
jgi:hypothetical protein